MRNKSNVAMTLAEVLITVGIIGLIAAFTIPSLLNKTNDAELTVAWKKEYSAFAQAYQQMIYDNGGDVSQWVDRATGNYLPDPFLIEFMKYFSVAKECITSNYNYICGTNNKPTSSTIYKTLSGGYVNGNNLAYGNILLNNGAQLYFRTYATGEFAVFIDVNGYQKGPNVLGRDLFGAKITKNKIMPYGAPGTGLENTCNATPRSFGGGLDNTGDLAGIGCSAEFLNK